LDSQEKEEETVHSVGLRSMANVHSKIAMDRRATRLAAHISKLLPESARVLDIGAGNGKLSRAICDLRPDVHIEGVDIKIWPERFIPLNKFDGHTIPAEDDSWDVCMICDVLHHCDNAHELLTEMKRVSTSSIIIKDHIANSKIDFEVLRFMDWFGNRGHGVVLPYNFWSWKKWEEEFEKLDLDLDVLLEHLALYPIPLGYFFDRKLHFIARLMTN